MFYEKNALIWKGLSALIVGRAFCKKNAICTKTMVNVIQIFEIMLRKRKKQLQEIQAVGYGTLSLTRIFGNHHAFTIIKEPKAGINGVKICCVIVSKELSFKFWCVRSTSSNGYRGQEGALRVMRAQVLLVIPNENIISSLSVPVALVAI